MYHYISMALILCNILFGYGNLCYWRTNFLRGTIIYIIHIIIVDIRCVLKNYSGFIWRLLVFLWGRRREKRWRGWKWGMESVAQVLITSVGRKGRRSGGWIRRRHLGLCAASNTLTHILSWSIRISDLQRLFHLFSQIQGGVITDPESLC